MSVLLAWSRGVGDDGRLYWSWITRFSVIFVLLLALAGCATHVPPDSSPVVECQQLWERMDGLIAEEGGGDGFAARISGFDYLRSDRFLAALGQEADSSREERALVERMRMLDLHQRYQELEFLSDGAWAELTGWGYSSAGGVFKRQVARCSVKLMQDDRQGAGYFKAVMAAVAVDQDYSTMYRTLGFYPLSKFIVQHQVQQYQKTHRVQLTPGLVDDPFTIEPPQGRKLSAKRLQLLLKNSRLLPFLDFQLSDQFTADLVRFYAPVFQLAGQPFGRIRPGLAGSDWVVDEGEPVVYYYLSHALLQGIPALQINYVVWFTERNEPAPWYTKGHLDGITVRVTLDWQGRPLVFDSIGNCGCFYFGLHNEALTDIKAGGPGFKPHFVGILPDLDGGQHVQVQVAAGSNEVVGISSASLAKEGRASTYSLMPYSDLERFSPSLPRKFFNGHGVVEGSDRFERFFLFPMGIPHIGAMRQRGRQPITLVGRAYFDDPYLFDTLLTIREPLPRKKKLIKKSKKNQSNLQRRVESSKSMGQTGRSSKDKYFRRKGMEM